MVILPIGKCSLRESPKQGIPDYLFPSKDYIDLKIPPPAGWKKGEGYSGKVPKLGSGVMRQLKWSQNKTGTLNGKVGHITLFTVAYYPERGYFVAPKLPGLNQTILVNSEEAGKRKAEALYQRYFDFLKGEEWYQEHNYRKPTSQGYEKRPVGA